MEPPLSAVRFVALEMEHRALLMLGKPDCPSELHPQLLDTKPF